MFLKKTEKKEVEAGKTCTVHDLVDTRLWT